MCHLCWALPSASSSGAAGVSKFGGAGGGGTLTGKCRPTRAAGVPGCAADTAPRHKNPGRKE